MLVVGTYLEHLVSIKNKTNNVIIQRKRLRCHIVVDRVKRGGVIIIL